MQVASLEERIKLLNKKHNKLLKDRDSAEAEYRVQATKGHLTESEMKETIEKARESVQEPKLLQAIYLAHKKVVTNRNTAKHEKQQMETLRKKANVWDTNMASLKGELRQKADEVPERGLAHTHTHTHTHTFVSSMLTQTVSRSLPRLTTRKRS